MVSWIIPKNERIFYTQDSEFRAFFGRIQETNNCFRDLLTFNCVDMLGMHQIAKMQMLQTYLLKVS